MTEPIRIKSLRFALLLVGFFAIWSSVVHGAIMAVQSLQNPEHFGHLYGDVPVLLAAAAILAFLMPRQTAGA